MRSIALPKLGRLSRRWLLAGGMALTLYAGCGFLLAPAILRHPIERYAGEILGREVRIDRLRLNPFAISVTVDGLQITDRDRTPLLHWERLYVDFAALRSLWRREWVVGEIRLIGASARLALLPGEVLNIDDLIKRFGTAEATQAPAGPPPVFSIGRLRIEDSSLAFVDRSSDVTFTTTLGPVRLDLHDFTTRRDERNAYSVRGRTEAGETFAWEGNFSFEPLRSEGKVSFEGVQLSKYRPYYRGVVPFDIRDGRADLRSGYRLTWNPGHPALELLGSSADVRDLKLSEHDKEEIALEAPTIEVRDGNIDLIKGAATIGSFTTQGGRALVRKSKEGRVNLIDMVLPFFEEPATPPARGGVAAGEAALKLEPGAPAAKVRVGELSFKDYTMDAQDLSQARPVNVRLDQINIILRNVDNVPGSTGKGSLDLRFAGAGTIHADGDLSLVGLTGDFAVRLEGIDVRPLDPYVEPVLDLRVTSGSFFADGHVRANLYDTARPQFSFLGNVRMTGFAAVDGRRKQDLLRWESVRMKNVDYSLDRDRMRIADVEIGGAGAVLAISSDNRINLLDVLRMPQILTSPEGEDGTTAEMTPPPATPPSPPAPAPTAPTGAGDTRIDRARIARCDLRMVDGTMTPPATLSVTHIEGTLAGLSSRPGARADVHLKMLVQDTSPVTLEGKVDPLGSDQFSDLVMVGKGIDLAPLGPYSARYLGFALDRARLDLDMRYRLENRTLRGENLFTANPFLLGEKTNSPDATHLPVRLGLALLRDRNGVIALDVPVEGSLDDPKFRLGRVILHAVVNVFTKLVTSPFKLLARSFAGREDVDLSVIEFPPGSAALPEAARPNLDALSKGLTERPGLTLAIAGASDPATDTEVLRRGKLENLLRTEKWNALGRKEREAVKAESLSIAPAERPKYLKAAWKSFKELHPDAAQAPKPETPEEFEARVLAGIEVGAEDLSNLAAARAQVVRTFFSATGIGEDRLFMQQSTAAASRVTLDLQ